MPSKSYYQKNPEAYRQKTKDYYLRNREARLAYARAYQQKNKRLLREKRRRYVAKNRKTVLEKQRQYRLRNLEKRREAAKQYAREHRIRAKNYQRKYKYGLSVGDYHELRRRQRGKCAICRLPKNKLIVDHCHSTGSVRGLLCSPCNSLIGFAKDSRSTLKSAINYLKSAG